jgi:hypothetical protein
MTEYERLVSEGKMPPMTGLDGLFIGSLVEDLLNNRDTIDEELFEAIEGVDLEIEFLFRNEPDKLKQLESILNKYRDGREPKQ